MPSAGQRAARSALEMVRPTIGALARATDPAEIRAGVVASWQGTEDVLRALGGVGEIHGQSLIQELRKRNLLSLREAHAFIDFQVAAERAAADAYQPTSQDVMAAREGFDRLVDAVESGGVEPAGDTASPEIAKVANTDVLPSEPVPSRNQLGRVLVAVMLLLVVGAGVTWWMVRGNDGDLVRGREAFARGDRVAAAAAFRTAALKSPTLAEPHVFLGRMAREVGDLPLANAELRRAVELEPNNAIAHRELGAFLLATGQPELARAFYERAIRLAPDDKNSLGFMGCTLVRLARPDLAARFFQRAGPGPWQACASGAVPQVPPR